MAVIKKAALFIYIGLDMTIRTQAITVEMTGSAGAATGSAKTGVVSGRILAVHLDYTTQPATCDVTVATSHTPVQMILTHTNANADGWFYPRVLLQDTAGANLTTVYDAMPVDDQITVTVAQGDPGSVVATVLYEA